jgi:cyclic nucleotide-binding protein
MISSKPLHQDALATSKDSAAYDLHEPSPSLPTISEMDRAIAVIFRGLVREETELLVSLGRSVTCRAGQTVVRVGERGGEMFVVLEGSLMEMARQNRRESDPRAVYLRGDILGEAPFAVAGVRPKSIMAMEDSRLLALSIECLDDLVVTMPRLAAKIFRNIAGIVAIRFHHEIGCSGIGLLPEYIPWLDAIGPKP